MTDPSPRAAPAQPHPPLPHARTRAAAPIPHSPSEPVRPPDPHPTRATRAPGEGRGGAPGRPRPRAPIPGATAPAARGAQTDRPMRPPARHRPPMAHAAPTRRIPPAPVRAGDGMTEPDRPDDTPAPKPLSAHPRPGTRPRRATPAPSHPAPPGALLIAARHPRRCNGLQFRPPFPAHRRDRRPPHERPPREHAVADAWRRAMPAPPLLILVPIPSGGGAPGRRGGQTAPRLRRVAP